MTKNKWLLGSVLSAVSVASIAAAQPSEGGRFAKLDTNSDGVVTTAELESHALVRWTEADANRDGQVTAGELKARFEAHAQERFTKRDANGNGVLERTEVAKMPNALFAKLDADQSGSLSRAEMTSGHRNKHAGKGPRGIERKVLRGDANNDGSVTKEEAIAGVQSILKRIDADGDGKLTKEELARGHGRHGAPGNRRGSRPNAG